MQSLNAETQDARGCTVDAFHAVRATTERLVQGLTPDDCMVQSMPDASPVKWHLAHTSWFFEQFILGPAGVAPFDERYAALFNSYYVGAGTRHPRARRGDLSRPPLDEVLAYRRHVTRAVADLLPRADPHATALARLGIEHEQQHQELILTDLKHHLFSQPLTPAYRPVPAHDGAEPAALQFTAVDGGLCDIGHAGGAFGFDNEFPRHRVWLEPLEITDRLVTEAEYLAFMHDGGYAQATLWLSDGWATREAEGWQAPCTGAPMKTAPGKSSPWVAGARRAPTCRCATSAITRPMPSPAGPAPACPPKPNGNTPRQPRPTAHGMARCWKTRPFTPRPPRMGRACGSCWATAGNGRPAPTCPTPATACPQAPWANTTASSCRGRWC